MRAHEGPGPASACSPSAWAFCRAEEFWRELKPATPWGADLAARREALSDRAAVLAAFDDVDAVDAWFKSLERGSARLDRIGWHLARMPRLPDFPPRAPGPGTAADTVYDAVELFLFKKFVSNYRSLVDLVDDPGLRSRVGLEFRLQALAAALDPGGTDPEAFMFTERHEPALGPVRRRLSELGAAAAAAREALERAALEAWGIDFSGRDFLTVPAGLAMRISSSCGSGAAPPAALEAYDERSFVVRLLPDAAMLEIERERESLREREAELERKVAAALSEIVVSWSHEIVRSVGVVLRFDIARARRNLAAAMGLVRPVFGPGPLVVEGGRFIPLEGDCGKMGTAYVPLDFTMDEPAAVLFGSNMGGKTVVLQTVIFLQVMAQCCLFVPAAGFRTDVYSRIEYVGEGASGRTRGLSGFGFEIRGLSDAWERASHAPCMVAFDEFARTTGSVEAEALLGAAVTAFAGARGSRALFTTHFRGAAGLPGAASFRMAGLDLERARLELGDAASGRAPPGTAATAATAGTSSPAGAGELDDRIRKINGLMDYRVLREDPASGGGGSRDRSDAIEIALLLGLDPRMVADASRRFGTGTDPACGDRGVSGRDGAPAE